MLFFEGMVLGMMGNKELCRSTLIQNEYLHTNTEYLFNHLFSFSFRLFLLPIFLLPRSAPARGKRGSAPFETPAPPLRRFL
ncbi:hypothetical protein BREVNS_0430 [Brevinematales bacterium NS]|nr:hypothetical protein BREVNS_0430 [Brevinematales bacterium NS]